MSSTETIIGFAAKNLFEKVFGAPAKLVTGYHKTHFQVLAKIVAESRRDSDLQASLDEIRKGLSEMTKAGQNIMRAIPATPAPPETNLSFLTDRSKAAAYQQQVDQYRRGVQAVIGVLSDYAIKARDCLVKTQQDIRSVESNLNMNGMKFTAFRQVSNSARKRDIQFILVQDIPALQRQIGAAESLLRTYRNH